MSPARRRASRSTVPGKASRSASRRSMGGGRRAAVKMKTPVAWTTIHPACRHTCATPMDKAPARRADGAIAYRRSTEVGRHFTYFLLEALELQLDLRLQQ